MFPRLEITLKALYETSLTDCPNYRFEQCTRHNKSGLYFTLAAIIPRLPPMTVFRSVDPEDAKKQWYAVSQRNRYGNFTVLPPLLEMYITQPTAWCVTSLDETSPVTHETLLICLENSRTFVEFDNTLFPL